MKISNMLKLNPLGLPNSAQNMISQMYSGMPSSNYYYSQQMGYMPQNMMQSYSSSNKGGDRNKRKKDDRRSYSDHDVSDSQN